MKHVNDFATYELLMLGTAFGVTGAVVVVGMTPVLLLASLAAPVAAGFVAYKYKL